MLHKLQYISQGLTPEEHLINIDNVLNAGVKLIQLRLKNVDDVTYFETALKAKDKCSAHSAQLIINDNAEVAEKSNADALHLGLNDMKVSEARNIVGKKIIGGTANTFNDVELRCNEGVDYIGLGPYRFTSTKEKLSPVLGLEGYKNIITMMKDKGLNTPVYAIGGIELSDIEKIIHTGVYGIAVSGMLTRAENKKELVDQINKILYNA